MADLPTEDRDGFEVPGFTSKLLVGGHSARSPLRIVFSIDRMQFSSSFIFCQLLELVPARGNLEMILRE
jgi:hypothetical protein